MVLIHFHLEKVNKQRRFSWERGQQLLCHFLQQQQKDQQHFLLPSCNAVHHGWQLPIVNVVSSDHGIDGKT